MKVSLIGDKFVITWTQKICFILKQITGYCGADFQKSNIPKHICARYGELWCMVKGPKSKLFGLENQRVLHSCVSVLSIYSKRWMMQLYSLANNTIRNLTAVIHSESVPLLGSG